MLPAGAKRCPSIGSGAVADQDPETARLEREAEAARAEYLRNREAVLATPVDHRRWTPMRITTASVGLVTLVLFVLTVISYYNSSQETGPTNVDLPTAVSIAALATCWCAILPFMIESRRVGIRVRNIVIAALVTAVLVPLCIPLFGELGSLVADLAYNISH
jgi:hypothetical protein